MDKTGYIFSTVITSQSGVKLDCYAFSVANEGTRPITVFGRTLNQGEEIPFGFANVKIVQDLDISFGDSGTIRVIVNQCKTHQNC